MAVLDNIVSVQISISQAAAESNVFEKMLILGTAPSSESATAADFDYYASLADVLSAGWVATEDVYKAASIAFANGANGIYIALYDDETGTNLTNLLNDCMNEGGWYGLVTVGVASTAYATIATWCDMNHKLFGYSVVDSGALVPAGNTSLYTFGIAYDSTGANNEFIHVAYMAKCFTYTPGTETWAYKTLSGITAASYTPAQVSAFKAAHVNCYAIVAGRSVTIDGETVSGEWIDIMRYCDYLASTIQAAVFRNLSGQNKVPYNAAGIAAVESVIRNVLSQGQSNGSIEDEAYDDDGNVIPGFTVTVPSMASISAATRQTRVLSGVKFSARLTGAVHVVEIVGTLTE